MYQYICPKCEGRSFSASKLSNLSNPECPYCGFPLDAAKGQRPDTKRDISILTGEKTSNEKEPYLKSE